MRGLVSRDRIISGLLCASVLLNVTCVFVCWKLVAETRSVSSLRIVGKNGETIELGDLIQTEGEHFGLSIIDSRGTSRIKAALGSQGTFVRLSGSKSQFKLNLSENESGTLITAFSANQKNVVRLELSDYESEPFITYKSSNSGWKNLKDSSTVLTCPDSCGAKDQL